MPSCAPRPCLRNGCPTLVANGYCDAHRRKEEQRPSSHARGYTRSWARIRLWFLRRHPLCAVCGRTADCVDHIRPLARGGTHDEGNLQAMCTPCHTIKTNEEDGGGFRGRRK